MSHDMEAVADLQDRLREAGRMAQRGADNILHELGRDPTWQPTRADYKTLAYLLQNIAGRTGIRATLVPTSEA